MKMVLAMLTWKKLKDGQSGNKDLNDTNVVCAGQSGSTAKHKYLDL